MSKIYQINTENLEAFLDQPSTDDLYYEGINKTQPVGCSNGLAYIDDGYGSVLKIQFIKKLFGIFFFVTEHLMCRGKWFKCTFIVR